MSSIPASFPPVQSIALIGLGAIGILYADKLYARDPECLRVIADPDRIKRYKADPPSFNGRKLDLNYVTPEAPGEPVDLILVAVKSTDLGAIFSSLAPFLSESTQILPLLNGISAQDPLAEMFGWDRVLHGLVYCASSMRDGNAVVQSGGDKIVFGEATNDPPSPRVQAVADFFHRLDIRYDVPVDMPAAQWRKFILNIGINQSQAVLQAPSREIQQNPEALQLARDLMKEAAAVGTALGIAGVEEVPAWAETIILGAAPENRTSMLQDVQAGRPTEVDLFAGTLCRLAREQGIPTPANDRVVRQLSDS
jgi:2-dehydropantoate 2-reductase